MTPFIVAGAVVLLIIAFTSFFPKKSNAFNEYFLTADPSTVTSSAPDHNFIDDYLTRLVALPQGTTELGSTLSNEIPRFNSEMVRALETEPKWAIGRAILYISFTSFFVPVYAPLACAIKKILPQGTLVPLSLQNIRVYSAGNFLNWWEANKSVYDIIPSYEQWRNSERYEKKQLFLQQTSGHKAGSGMMKAEFVQLVIGKATVKVISSFFLMLPITGLQLIFGGTSNLLAIILFYVSVVIISALIGAAGGYKQFLKNSHDS